MQCPFCKQGSLTKYDSSPQGDTFTCTRCQKLTHTKKNALGVITEIVTPVSAFIGGLAGAASLFQYFGVKDFHDLVNTLTGADPSPGPQATKVDASPGQRAPDGHAHGGVDHVVVISLANSDQVRVSVIDPGTGAHRDFLFDAPSGASRHVGVASDAPAHHPGHPYHAPPPAAPPSPGWFAPPVAAPMHPPLAPPPVPFHDAVWGGQPWPSPAVHGASDLTPHGFPTPHHVFEPFHHGSHGHAAVPHFGEVAEVPVQESSNHPQPHELDPVASRDDSDGSGVAPIEFGTGMGFDGAGGVDPSSGLGEAGSPSDVA